MFNPEIEYQPRTVIKAFQEEKLREDLQYLKARSKFYQNLFQKEQFALGTPPSKIDSMIHGIPIPPYCKKKLLKELDAIGINDAFLFPELEHQATYVKQQFFSTLNHKENSEQ